MQLIQVKQKTLKDQISKLYRAKRREKKQVAIDQGFTPGEVKRMKKLKLYEVTGAIVKRGLEHPDTVRELTELEANGFIS